MRMLAIDTSTNVCTIAVGDESAMTEAAHHERRDLARCLATWTDVALSAAGWRADDVEMVAIGRGPGSWTGLRIGISFARAFAWARGVRCVGVPSADATAHAFADEAHGRIIYVMPANARQVVIAEFAVEPGCIRKCQAEHNIEAGALVRQLEADTVPTLVCGEGAALLRDAIAPRSWPPAHVGLVNRAVTARLVADHARRLLAANAETLFDISPIYAAPSSAEIKLATASS